MTATLRRRRRARWNGDRGIAVVFFAISVTALLAVGALVLGGSVGYTAVRNAQTAADSAAVVGASTLRAHKLDWVATPAAELIADVRDAVESNGATLEPGACKIVTSSYGVDNAESEIIADCEDLETLTAEQFVEAAGVRVTVSDERNVPFAAFVDQDTITGTAVASATVQRLAGPARAPFMMCATADDHVVPLLEPDPTLDPPYRVNPSAVGEEFVLWSNGNGFGDRNCGRSSWHGLVNTSGTYQIPSDPDDESGWWDIDTGSKVGHLPDVLAGDDTCFWAEDAIDPSAVGCRLPVPLCSAGSGQGTNTKLRCDRFATFEITFVSDGRQEAPCVNTDKQKKTVCAVMVAGGVAVGGRGTADPVDENEVVIIKLVE